MASSTAAMIDAESLAKIRGLLAAGTSEGVTLGLALLESLGATAADLDAALVPPVDRAVAAVADGWLQGDEHGRMEYERYHRLVVAPRFFAAREADRRAGRPFLDLVEIPAGEFDMGSEWRDDEKPVHRVRITKAFLLGKTTVTQGQWWSVMGTLPWKEQKNVTEGHHIPAAYVSWDDAVEFCARLTKLEQSSEKLRGNRRYRLPTEAEWEYACRAGTKTKYSFGDDDRMLLTYAWYGAIDWSGWHGIGGLPYDDQLESTPSEVGLRKPNPWGLYDVHGNVWEWCSDWYDEDFYKNSPMFDPPGPASACSGSDRVLRGGCWAVNVNDCRSARRFGGPPSQGNAGLGFRVVQSQACTHA